MGKSDPETSTAKGSRKRQLNVIYFVDSARTRSFTMPLGRLNVLLLGLFGLVAWAAVSTSLCAWLVRANGEQAGRLRNALATIFDYETRDDGVFDLAYPPASAKATAGKPAPTSKPAPAAGLPAVALAEAGVTVGGRPNTGGAAPRKPEAPVAASVAAGATHQVLDEGEEVSDVKDANAPEQPQSITVIVSNPVLEAKATALQLRFDLTSKASTDKAEGYIWAVAEFRADSGERVFIGAPSDIEVKADGEPTFPQRSALFAIRRFKQKSFTFPFVKDKTGLFVGVKIGIMDRSGENKTTYSVPVQIRAGKTAKDDGGAGAPSGAPKPG